MKTLPSKYVSDIAFALAGGCIVALLLVTCLTNRDYRIDLLALGLYAAFAILCVIAIVKPFGDELDARYIKKHTTAVFESVKIGTVSECNISGECTVIADGQDFELENQAGFTHAGEKVMVHLLDYIDKNDGGIIYRRATYLEHLENPAK